MSCVEQAVATARRRPGEDAWVGSVPYALLGDKDPGKVALHFLGADCTYRDLQRRVGAVAGYLSQNGATKGDRVLLVGESSEFWVSVYLGAMAAGLVCVPLPPATSPEDIAYIAEITEARIAFVQTKLVERTSAGRCGIDIVTDRQLQSLPATTPWPSDWPHDRNGGPPAWGDDLAAIMFTSGSTGKPRGVMISHANILANTRSIVESLDLSERDRTMAVLPFHYCFGTSLLHTHLFVGGSLVVDTRFMYPETVLQRMLDTECTGFAGVPSHFQILLRNSSLRRRSFPQLRYVQQAGGCLPPPFLQDLQAALPGTKVYVMYGQTEATARLSCLPAELLGQRLGSIGKGIPGVTLRVLNEAGEDVRPGEIGEIVATGQNVAGGYWRAPEESAACFRDQQLFTGDLATVDADGFIYIVDRAKDFVKCGGQRVSCRRIEEEVLRFDELTEAAAVGVADEVLGEAVRLFVVANPPAPSQLAERLIRRCKSSFVPAEIIKEIVLVDRLPKNDSGKILKAQLKTL